MSVEAIKWQNEYVEILDQRLLPGEIRYIPCRDFNDVVSTIKDMAIRGAPAIGIAGAIAMAIGARSIDKEGEEFLVELHKIGNIVSAARPTAVNLKWAVERVERLSEELIRNGVSVEEVKRKLREEAILIWEEDIEANKRMGAYGNLVVPKDAKILTHCNAGALATGGYGTAIGVIRTAHESGKKVEVYADETRPYLQGARLTAFELTQLGIPVTVIPDSLAGYLMQRRMIDMVIVGADRVAANGDVANKVGTYALASLAHHHEIPFYVAFPMSTIDYSIKSGDLIPLEERPEKEMTHIFKKRIVPEGAKTLTIAFDVTPHQLITALITDRGVVYPPFDENLQRLKKAHLK